MKRFKNNNHYTIYGWMIHDLHLKDAKLNIYAIVYSFAQDGKTEFYGGRKYMAEATQRSLCTVDRTLLELEQEGLIKKLERENDGVSHCRYSVFLNDDGEGIIDPAKKQKEENEKSCDDNRCYHDDSTPSYHDDSTNNKDNIYNNKDKDKENKKKTAQEGFVFEDDHEANFIQWCKENVPNLMENKRPLTYKQFNMLLSEFTRNEILDKMLYINAISNFNRKYKDVYGVLKNWLNRDKDPNYTQRFKNRKKTA